MPRERLRGELCCRIHIVLLLQFIISLSVAGQRITCIYTFLRHLSCVISSSRGRASERVNGYFFICSANIIFVVRTRQRLQWISCFVVLIRLLQQTKLVYHFYLLRKSEKVLWRASAHIRWNGMRINVSIIIDVDNRSDAYACAHSGSKFLPRVTSRATSGNVM